MMPAQRYLQGTAYIVYGPGPPTDVKTKSLSTGSSNATVHQDQFHGNCNHPHREHHAELQDPQSHFWVVFRPDRNVQVQMNSHSQQNHQQHNNNNSNDGDNDNDNVSRLIIIKGTPHPWGSYPSDMPPPHGCIPPHLYYHVTISEYNDSDSDISAKISSSSTDPKDEKTQETNLNTTDLPLVNEWTLPFVHRIGDGKDDAGGLTSAYYLLQDLEDADDYGAFLDQKFQQTQLYDGTPSLYASTQVLISERRTLQVLEQHVFVSSKNVTSMNDSSNGCCPDKRERVPRMTLLRELQSLVSKHVVKDSTAMSSLSHQLPFCVLKSDMKLILPIVQEQVNAI